MQTWLSQLSAASKTHRHRQVIWLAGDHHWAWQLINPWLSQFKQNVYVGQAELKHAFLTCTKASKPSTLLGYESDNLVFDAHHGLFPDALTAVSGTLLPGGFLFLLTPALKDYPYFADEFSKGRTSLGFESQCNNKHTIKRLLDCAAKHHVHILEQDNLQSLTGSGIFDALPAPIKNITDQDLKSRNKHFNSTKSQQSVYKHILNNINTRSNSPTNQPIKQMHVITADRGRGKSHLLGMLASSIINQSKDNGIKYYLCAPNKASTSSVYKHLDETVKRNLQFIAPERLMESAKPDDLIFIDEAASLPISQLTTWSQHFETLIMATTTHGYEGTGKGFQIRFFQHLNQLSKTDDFIWHQHTLLEPVRYREGDPLESWLFDAFCLDAEPSALTFSQSTIQHAFNTLEIKHFTKSELNNSPLLLKQIFALLVQAHYQTKPSDLRDLLDAPGLHLFAQLITISNAQHVIGVCLFNDEGPIKNTKSSHEDLYQDILNGYRRPKGHLMPQVMAHHMGALEALTIKGARIVRIATLENVQRNGLGSELLKAVIDYCKENQYDYLGSSFADTKDVRLFWFKNEFKLIRQGNKQDKASGTQSALVIYGVTPRGIKLEENMLHFFERQTLPVESLDELKPNEAQLLNAFLNHSGSYESAKMILKRITGFDLAFPKKASKEFKAEIKDWLGI